MSGCPWIWLSGIVLLACATGAERAPVARVAQVPTAEQASHYTVTLDADMRRLDVRLCFEGTPPERLVYGTRVASEFLIAPERVNKAGRRLPVAVQAGVMLLPGVASDECVSYGLDVQRALDHDSLLLAYPGEGSLLLAAELFLWRPVVRSSRLQSTLRFVLPEGLRASAPWQELAADGSAYRLDELAYAFTGHVVLGKFDASALPAPGTRLRLVTLPGFSAQTAASIGPWIEHAARLASLPGGVFPVGAAQVIVVPTSPSSFPIHFGHTGRSGGASIVLFMPTDMDEAKLRDDWIAIHEFSHLWHPFVRREDAWLSEGIATYLQEVLRARAGLITSDQLWARLFEGAELGRQATGSLPDETRRMAFEHNYQRVYWAGAAIALMIDVELRARSRGAQSLELLLARLRHEPAWYTRARSAAEMLRALDGLADDPVCEAVAGRYLQGALPDLRPTFRALGVTSEALGPRESASAAPLSWVREAILAGPSEVASARPGRGG